MGIRTTRRNSAQHIETDADTRLDLEACRQEAGDAPACIVHALGVIARAWSMRQLARDRGLTREGLYKALPPEGGPTFGAVAKVAVALGLQITVQVPRVISSDDPSRAASDAGARIASA